MLFFSLKQSTNLSYNQEVNVQSDAPAAYRNKESEDDIPKFRSKRQTSNGSEKPLAEYRAENVVVMVKKW